MGIQGFPSTLLREDKGLTLLTKGWVPFQELENILAPWLADDPVEPPIPS
jgi:hypothetical protein